jgi:type IV secretory pathway TrbD component
MQESVLGSGRRLVRRKQRVDRVAMLSGPAGVVVIVFGLLSWLVALGGVGESLVGVFRAGNDSRASADCPPPLAAARRATTKHAVGRCRGLQMPNQAVVRALRQRVSVSEWSWGWAAAWRQQRAPGHAQQNEATCVCVCTTPSSRTDTQQSTSQQRTQAPKNAPG